MTVKDLSSDPEKVAIILLIQKIKVFNHELGAYIEHYSYTEQDIIIKLTNGYLKIKEYLVDEVARNNNDFTLPELEKSSKTFVKLPY